ncbi:SRPBCC domain-containing protein [Neiella marina]|uniref:SRPBCC domain-containing protein n=2 Tax=Neiella holothuriorum TaxID=2870530 RepID=A0ABS7EMD0_9GAMM|nr:SRPBCC domain-containing protein [Neiella holothuriorum]
MRGIVLCISLMMMTSSAIAQVVHIAPHGFIVENQVVINQPAEKVWHALIEDVDQWWPKDHSWWQGTFSIDAKAGGCFCEISGGKSAEHMRISFVEPRKLLRMTGGLGPLQGMGMHGALDWQLANEGLNTKVTLTYRVSGIDPDGFDKLAPVVSHVQGLQLNALKHYLSR